MREECVQVDRAREGCLSIREEGGEGGICRLGGGRARRAARPLRPLLSLQGDTRRAGGRFQWEGGKGGVRGVWSRGGGGAAASVCALVWRHWQRGGGGGRPKQQQGGWVHVGGGWVVLLLTGAQFVV